MAFWKIYWPLSRGGVVSGLILVFTLSLGFYVTPALLGSPQQSLIAQLLAQRTTQLLDFAGAGALGMLVLVVTLVLVAWANRFGGSISAIGVVATSRTKEKLMSHRASTTRPSCRARRSAPRAPRPRGRSRSRGGSRSSACSSRSTSSCRRSSSSR